MQEEFCYKCEHLRFKFSFLASLTSTTVMEMHISINWQYYFYTVSVNICGLILLGSISLVILKNWAHKASEFLITYTWFFYTVDFYSCTPVIFFLFLLKIQLLRNSWWYCVIKYTCFFFLFHTSDLHGFCVIAS